MRTRRARGTGTRLFAVYAAASLVPVLTLGGVLADGIQQDARDRGLELGRAQAAVVGEMVIAPALQGSDLTLGLSTQERARPQTYFQLASDVQYEPGLYGIGVALDRPELRDALAAALARLIETGNYQRVLGTWDVASGAVSAVTVNGGAA
jgi:ABC-type amino acid transport substrate-binding protein